MNTKLQVLAALRERPRTRQELAADTGISARSIGQSLRGLMKGGQIVEEHDGRLVLTAALSEAVGDLVTGAADATLQISWPPAGTVEAPQATQDDPAEEPAEDELTLGVFSNQSVVIVRGDHRIDLSRDEVRRLMHFSCYRRPGQGR